ncbi:hypothetical protein CMV_009221 [Castanea mollissima]|uniref:Uncharacterized protein n=1 Tax=Castanea mollissima TaxID=60419 RepID=A0A8J4VR62_9ROSI|nr:hypothetical protein CMV_009221 [Castanea mollissima]
MSKCPSKIKAVNLEAKPVLGIAYGVKFKVDEWTRKVNFLVMELDDFDLILGNEFLVSAKAALLPFIEVLLILDEKQSCYVPVRRGARNSKSSKGKEPMVSAMQVEHGLKKGEMTYLATLIKVKQDKYVDVPDAVAGMLGEFADVQEYVAALTRVESGFVERIKDSAKLNATYQMLVHDVTVGLVRRY